MAESANSEVFDLDAFEPKDRKEPFQFRFGGELFTTRDPHEFDVRDIAAGENPAMTLALMLGEEGWERLDAMEASFTMEHLNVILEKWFAHHGVDLGKLDGSPGSSKTMRIR